MNEPRPAMISARPPERRSSVAKSWNTRTGSSELSTLTALVSRIRWCARRRPASTTAGAETAKSGRWCSPTAEDVEPDLVGELDLLDQVAQPLRRRDRPPCRRVGRELREGIETELHPVHIQDS